MPSRRAVLAGAGGVVAAGAAAASQVRLDGVDARSPRPDTWPLDRYGPANTAANPGASVPADPAVGWRTGALDPADGVAVVAGRTTVYAGGAGVAALDRADGSVRWRRDVPGGALALRDGTLYAAPVRPVPDGHRDAGPTALDAADGSRRWHADAGGAASQLLVADGILFVGQFGALSAYGTRDGSRRWSDASITGAEGARAMVHDGALYVVVERLVRYGRRRLLDRLSGSGPPRAWQTGRIEHPAVPTVAAGRVVLGSGLQHPLPGRPVLAGYDPADGERTWGTPPDDGPDRPVSATTPAVVGDRGFTGLRFGSRERRRHAVAGVSLADGTIAWRRPVGQWVTDLAAGRDAAVVATAADPENRASPPGTVRAFDLADGRERWRVGFGSPVDTVAVVDGSVFAATEAGRVVALR